MTKKAGKFLRRMGRCQLAVVLVLNIIAAFHAWRFTHFTDTPGHPNDHPGQLSTGQKLSIAFTGIPLPRPANKSLPPVQYENIILQSNVRLAAWYIPAQQLLRTVSLFHGYGGERSGMLQKAMVFHQLGYNVLLPDFIGAGGSEGTQTTIGFKEAENVNTCVEWIKNRGEQKIMALR
jgi:fermentation-respiration switch protein FrsA (DUF1100 family)